MQNKTLFVISHTHWDREWYENFQNYRFRLVRLIDDLLDILESDSSYEYFHFDGQTIMLEDYLEIRPENDNRLRKLIKDGRILIGPWYVMPDEFLVSGESLVRNLQKGHQICEEYQTQAMKVGYVTDIFGHNAQFPQILNGFGIDSATLFRGVGDYPKDTFMWEGADSSKVITMRLDRDRCYSNFYFSLRWPFEGREIDNEELIQRAKEMLARSEKAAVCDAILMMDGVDHVDAEPRLPQIIKTLNDNLENVTVKHATINEYLYAVKQENPDLDTLSGPLYHVGGKGLNNVVLKNVLSSMVHLKQSNAACEALLTGWAEPFDFATSCIDEKKSDLNIRHAEPRAGFINTAWKYLLQNHPHDSICGCSISDVHQDNEYRFRQVLQIGDRITQDALECIAENIDTSACDGDFCFSIFNPSQKAIQGYTTFTIDLPPQAYKNFKLFDCNGAEIPYQILHISEVWQKRVAPIRMLISFLSLETITVAADIKIVPNGYTVLTAKTYKKASPGDGEYRVDTPEPSRYLGTMRTARNQWDNGALIMEVEKDGTLSVTNKNTGRKYENILTFEDCGDVGDGWNYIKPAQDQEFLSSCADGDFCVISDGPFAAVIEITRRMMLPMSATADLSQRSPQRQPLEIRAVITMIKDSEMIDIKTTVNNQIQDHRLRVMFPTQLKTDCFYTQTPYDMQKWTVQKEDWSKCNEIDTLVNPMQGTLFMGDSADSVEVYSKGLYEVEVTENDRTVALTLFRAFPSEVGQTHSDMGKMQREMTFEYAVCFGKNRTPSQALLGSNNWGMGTKSFETGIHYGSLPLSRSFVEFDSKASIISALTQKTGNEKTGILRFYNPSDKVDTVSISFCKPIMQASKVDFCGNKLNELEVKHNGLALSAKPHEIVTIEFILG